MTPMLVIALINTATIMFMSTYSTFISISNSSMAAMVKILEGEILREKLYNVFHTQNDAIVNLMQIFQIMKTRICATSCGKISINMS